MPGAARAAERLNTFALRQPHPEAMTLILDLIKHPLLMLVWFGPVLWIRFAAFEEVSRVFVISRVTAIRAGRSDRLAAVVISTTCHAETRASGGITA